MKSAERFKTNKLVKLLLESGSKNTTISMLSVDEFNCQVNGLWVILDHAMSLCMIKKASLGQRWRGELEQITTLRSSATSGQARPFTNQVEETQPQAEFRFI